MGYFSFPKLPTGTQLQTFQLARSGRLITHQNVERIIPKQRQQLLFPQQGLCPTVQHLYPAASQQQQTVAGKANDRRLRG